MENGEYALNQVTRAVAKSLYRAGKVDKDEPVDLSPEEREKYQWVSITSLDNYNRESHPCITRGLYLWGRTLGLVESVPVHLDGSLLKGQTI